MRFEKGRCIFHPRRKAGTTAHPFHHPLEAWNDRIAIQPIVFDHVREHVLCSGRQMVCMLLQQMVGVLGKLVERFGVVCFPTGCQKMVVKNVHNHGCIFSECFAHPSFALRYNGVAIGIMIDVPVQGNAFLDAFGTLLMAFTAFEMIGHEVAQNYFGIVA